MKMETTTDYMTNSTATEAFYDVTDYTTQPLDIQDNNSSFNGSLGDGNDSYLYTYPGSYYYDDSYYYEDDELHFLVTYPYEVVTLGFVRPILIFITTVANIFVAGFFMTKNNRGRATNILFVSIALSDTMTGLLLIPNSIYVYILKNDHLTKQWCNAVMLTRLYFSPVFHTVSIWQTVMLGTQRYMCVCHPFISSRLCTPGKTVLSIVIMYIMAIVLHIYHLLDNKAIDIPPRCTWPTGTVCAGKCVYLWFSVVLQHLLPCIILICLTIITLVELDKAKKRVSSMSSRSTSKRLSRDRIITITATLVVIVFLIPELPQGIYKTILTIHLHKKLGLDRDTRTNHLTTTIYEIVLLISFHANFWIYCSMMHDFRHAFLKFVTCGVVKQGMVRLRKFSGSLSSRKTSNTTFSRTSSVVSRNRVLSQTTSVHSTGSDTIHALMQLSPTKNGKATATRWESVDEQNDDVFV